MKLQFFQRELTGHACLLKTIKSKLKSKLTTRDFEMLFNILITEQPQLKQLDLKELKLAIF